MDEHSRIPLRSRTGEVVAEALIDAEDWDRVQGDARWHRNAYGYAVRFVGGRRDRRCIFLHRLIMGLPSGEGKAGHGQAQIDHINRDRLDNRKANLRITDYDGNRRNMSRYGGRLKSGRPRWVFPSGHRGDRWAGYFMYHNVRYPAGTFDTQEEASIAAQTLYRQITGLEPPAYPPLPEND